MIRLRSELCSGWPPLVRGTDAAADALLGQPPEHRGYAGMRVLDVVDGVLVGLLARQLDVQVERSVVRALEHEEASRVDTDLIQQIIERDELAPAL